jgi:hypothetical protein
MLIYSMSVSVDGFIADRDGAFGWSVPSDERTPNLAILARPDSATRDTTSVRGTTADCSSQKS